LGAFSLKHNKITDKSFFGSLLITFFLKQPKFLVTMNKLLLYFGVLWCGIAQPLMAQAPNFIVENGRLVLPGEIRFDADDTVADDAETNKVLDSIVLYMNHKTYISLLRVEGHLDKDRSAAEQQQRTEKRALSVVKALVKRGVACDRLIAVGFGDTKPVAVNDSPTGKAKNRRLEIRPAAMRKRPIGGMPVDGGGRVAGNPCQ
jgi:OmpA-OmpF porin, OOP family